MFTVTFTRFCHIYPFQYISNQLGLWSDSKHHVFTFVYMFYKHLIEHIASIRLALCIKHGHALVMLFFVLSFFLFSPHFVLGLFSSRNFLLLPELLKLHTLLAFSFYSHLRVFFSVLLRAGWTARQSASSWFATICASYQTNTHPFTKALRAKLSSHSMQFI